MDDDWWVWPICGIFLGGFSVILNLSILPAIKDEIIIPIVENLLEDYDIIVFGSTTLTAIIIWVITFAIDHFFDESRVIKNVGPWAIVGIVICWFVIGNMLGMANAIFQLVVSMLTARAIFGFKVKIGLKEREGEGNHISKYSIAIFLSLIPILITLGYILYAVFYSKVSLDDPELLSGILTLLMLMSPMFLVAILSCYKDGLIPAIIICLAGTLHIFVAFMGESGISQALLGVLAIISLVLCIFQNARINAI